MAVVAMIVIVTGIVFANYGIGKDSMALERAAQKLYQDFRVAINSSMAGSENNAGVGIYFDRTTSDNSKRYIIYQDEGGETANRVRSSDGSEDLYTVSIEDGVKICDIRNTSNTSVTTSTVFFKSPYPTTYLNPNSSDDTIGIARTPVSISVVLCMISDNSKTRTVSVNSSGMVNIMTN
jgi:type II secretory pathway pseudopilin PulG